ncbi:hypothetical protein ACIBO5_59140 [Nonomuraea angiospora]|uniref:hypothetical protein n=1 Tax=Nonomuraea angiospora TaxID=46172 RepID=UPI0037A1F521
MDGIEVHLAERDEGAETLPTVAVLVYDPRTKVGVEFNTPPAPEALFPLIAGLRDAAARAKCGAELRLERRGGRGVSNMSPARAKIKSAYRRQRLRSSGVP